MGNWDMDISSFVTFVVLTLLKRSTKMPRKMYSARTIIVKSWVLLMETYTALVCCPIISRASITLTIEVFEVSFQSVSSGHINQFLIIGLSQNIQSDNSLTIRKKHNSSVQSFV
uniref:Uncharacterized protein n=1 Tax=Cacopsylla melanoneura TaxID=428564 RepID=A0A8D8RQZ2_9HEMI